MPFSLVGIVGIDLLGEVLPLADGGQVIPRSCASVASSWAITNFRSASLAGSGQDWYSRPLVEGSGPAFRIFEQDLVAPFLGLLAVGIVGEPSVELGLM